MRRTLIGGLLLLITAVSAACTGLGGEPQIIATMPSQTNMDESSEQDIAAVMTLGGEIWMARCSECHGRMGEGTTEGAPLPDLTARTEAEILASITNGLTDKMPAFGDELSTEELEAAATYARMMSIAIVRGMVNPEQAADQSTPEAVSTPADAADVLGLVTGQVTMGTAGAAIPAELDPVLRVVKSEIEEETFPITLALDGSFRLDQIPFDAAYQYVITAPYGGITFVSDIVTVNPASPELNLPLTIYEPGAPAEAIQITSVNAQVGVQGDALQVLQIVSYVNTSDRFYLVETDSEPESIGLRAPRDAQFLNSMINQYRLSADGTRIASRSPVLPGETEVIHAAYVIPYSNSAAVDQTFDYALNGPVQITVATDGIALQGEGFSETGQTVSGSRVLTDYGAELSRPAGGSMRYEITGTPVLPAVTSSAAEISPIAYILIGAGLAALIIAGIIAYRERTAVSKSQPQNQQLVGNLLDQIADLDAEHKAGKIKDADYRQRRKALKDQLSLQMKGD